MFIRVGVYLCVVCCVFACVWVYVSLTVSWMITTYIFTSVFDIVYAHTYAYLMYVCTILLPDLYACLMYVVGCGILPPLHAASPQCPEGEPPLEARW